VLEVLTKEPIQIHLFANRRNARIAYEFSWDSTNWPMNGQASIANPTGSTGDSLSFEYRHPPGLEPAFEAREPGTYTVLLKATVEKSDPDFPGEEGRVAFARGIFKVTGKSFADLSGCGCQQLGALPGPPLLSFLMFALSAVLLAWCRRD
jgi:hypothetical protein